MAPLSGSRELGGPLERSWGAGGGSFRREEKESGRPSGGGRGASSPQLEL
jgi:hypothetical protein